MVDREKAIRILEGNYKSFVLRHNGELITVNELLALLKAQEPHIVKLDDYEDNPNVDKDGNLAVWRESRHFPGIAYHEDGWVVLNRNRVEGWFNSEAIRFWTSRPSDEAREATPWN